jgi:hypothetical protein
MRDLSVLIPSRNEMFLRRTIEDILEHKEANTEVIAVLDGLWADPEIDDHPDVTLIYHSKSVGQRAATNEAARISDARFIMKCDAHCAFDQGFDRKLMEDCEYDWTVIPRMYNLHGFDWVCDDCGDRRYQSPTPTKCNKCENTERFTRDVLWKPRFSRRTDFARFDKEMHFQYWGACEKRPESQGDIADTMCHVGAGWFMHRERYWDLGGLDERHGSWGQMGVEISCKSWLSGGRQVVNKKTWFAHMFRTQGGDFGFPYQQSNRQVEHARRHSRKLWQGGEWEGTKRPLSWLLNKFGPVPDWHDPAVYKKEDKRITVISKEAKPGVTLVYYSDNNPDSHILKACQNSLEYCMNRWEYPIITVTQKPIDFGQNIVLDLERSVLSMYKQILRGLEEAETEYVFQIEHDLLYHPDHFNFTPNGEDYYYFDRNLWRMDVDSGKAVYYQADVPSMMCAKRNLLIEHYRLKVDYIGEHGHTSALGFSPPKGLPKEMRIGKAKTFFSETPCIDLRHDRAFTRRRMTLDQFRKKPEDWKEAYEIPGWGQTKDIIAKHLAV